MRTLVVALTLAITLALAADVHGGPSASGGPPDGRPDPVIPPAAAHFQVLVTAGKGRPAERADWYLLRESARIETIRPTGGVAEIWERDARGDLSLKRVFHVDRRVIEYVPGELRARDVDPSWRALGSVVDPRALEQLKPTGTVKVPYGIATIYKGTIGAERLEVWWLAKVALPARLIRQTGDHRTTLSLQALHASPPPGWPRADAAPLAEYLVVDAADLGDLHNDPFVAKLQRFDALTGTLGRTRPQHTH